MAELKAKDGASDKEVLDKLGDYGEKMYLIDLLG